MRYFLNNHEITEEQCQRLEDLGKAHVRMGASGYVPDRLGGPKSDDEPLGWIEMAEGPSNVWLEEHGLDKRPNSL